MMDYRGAVTLGFARAISQAIKRETNGFRVYPGEIKSWLNAGTKNRPMQRGAIIIARHGRMIVAYLGRRQLDVAIPLTVWRALPSEA